MMLNLSNSMMSALLAILFTIPCHLTAQTAEGRIFGKVSDPSGAVISAAVVSTSSAGGKVSTTKTDRAGVFELRSLPPGKYRLSVSAPGFEVFTQDVDVTSGQDQKVDISLTIAKVEAKIDVRDEMGNGNTDPANNAGAIVLKAAEAAYMPKGTVFAPFAMNKHNPDAYLQQWSLDVQRTLPGIICHPRDAGA